MRYTIYTDGSYLKNPGGPGGYAAVIFREGEMIEELSGGEAVTTSNRMEITAAIVGLQAVQEPAVITLYSDSQYLIKTMPYQRRAQHAGQCGVEVEGGRVPTAEWFLNLRAPRSALMP